MAAAGTRAWKVRQTAAQYTRFLDLALPSMSA